MAELESAELDLPTVVGILRRQRRVLIGCVILTLAVALAYLLVATPVYRATVLLQVDGRGSNLLDPAATGQEQSAVLNSRIDGEVEILRSEATALAVVRAADLVADDEFGPQIGWVGKLGIALGIGLDGNALRRLVGLKERPEASGQALVDATQRRLQDAVEINRRGLTYLIEIAVTSTSPARAARLANAYAEVYVARQVTAKTQAALAARDVLRRQIAVARAQLSTSDMAVNDFIEANLSRLQEETTDPAVAILRGSLAEAKLLQADRRRQVALADTAIASQDWLSAADTLGDRALAELAAQRADLRVRLSRADTGSAAAVDLRGALSRVEAGLQAQSATALQAARDEMRSLGQREAEARDQLQILLLDSDLSAELMTDLFNLQQGATLAREQYQTLLSREKDLGALSNLQIADARVVSEALPPHGVAAPDRMAIAGLALLGGLGLGLVLSFLREFHLGGIVSASQLGNILQAPVPVSLHRLEDVRSGADPADAILGAPMSLYAESFRKLRAAVDAGLGLAEHGHGGLPETGGKVILVCSALQGEGKSTTAIALARTYAEAGMKTLLIDADMRRPAIATRLSMEGREGLIDFITADQAEGLTRVNLQSDTLSSLVVLTAGERSLRPTDQLLNGSAFRTLIEAARDRFGIIILDSPPILPVVDARHLSRHADAVVHVVRYATTRQSELRESLLELRRHIRPGAHYTGVLNLDEAAGSRYGTYAGYGHYGAGS